MGGGPQDPQAYSTQTRYTSDGTAADGYNVVIDPDQLGKAVTVFRAQLDGKSHSEMNRALNEALIDPSAFGVVPNAQQAAGELQKFVTTHLEAMSRMGISLADFVARVQAAQQLGTEADPLTKQLAARAARWDRMPI